VVVAGQCADRTGENQGVLRQRGSTNHCRHRQVRYSGVNNRWLLDSGRVPIYDQRTELT
jgi:hypothetical protein